MRTLQYRIALIITVSIVAVMLAATMVTSWVLSSGDGARMADLMAQHIAFSSDLLGRGMGPPDLVENPRPLGPPFPGPNFGPPMHREEIAKGPEQGTIRDDLTFALKTALAKQHATGDVVVTENATTGTLTASYRLSNGLWGVFDYPRPMGIPPSLEIIVGGWMATVMAGVVAVALIMARRVTRPFAILEAAVTSVGRDGVLPPVAETGSRESRHTARVLNQLSERLRISMESRMRCSCRP